MGSHVDKVGDDVALNHLGLTHTHDPVGLQQAEEGLRLSLAGQLLPPSKYISFGPATGMILQVAFG